VCGDAEGGDVTDPTTTLRSLRQRIGITQAELSTRSGVSALAIAAIEAGAVAHQLTRRRLLRALGLGFSNHRAVFGDTLGERRACSTTRVLEDSGDAA